MATTMAITSEDKEITTATKAIVPKTTFKEMPLPLGIHQTPASNVEK